MILKKPKQLGPDYSKILFELKFLTDHLKNFALH